MSDLTLDEPCVPDQSALEEDAVENCAFQARSVSRSPIAGVKRGVLVGIADEGATPLVIFPGQPNSAALRARSIVDLHSAHVGREVMLAFEDGDAAKPIVVGCIASAGRDCSLAKLPGHVELDADGARLIVQAAEQLVLKCGKATITLTKSGKVLIQGTYISSRSAGVNRVRADRCSSTDMEIINATRMMAGFTLATDPNGRESLVVVVKGTFRIPIELGHALQLHDEQVPLVTSDVFHGEPGVSSPKYEADFVPQKRRCDVLLNAAAYAPGGKASTRVEVSARVGSWSKSFAVVGDRVWESDGVGIGKSAPIAFVRMPISYDRAFGGVDRHDDDPAKHAAFMANPAGRGFHSQLRKEWVDGSPLPNTEEIGNPVKWVEGDYKPMSFGPIGRHWEQRAPYAGTYDQQWMDNGFPFLPADFDDRYFQAAPDDQQLALPLGEQVVTLTNLTPEGASSFVLPHFAAPIQVFPKKGRPESMTASADTVIIEPDEHRVCLVWRVARPLSRNIFEIGQVLVGQKPPGWWRARRTGKKYLDTAEGRM